MRHTLIPPQERLAIHREYHIRSLVVLAISLAIAICLGMAALFPAYLSAYSAENASRENLAFMRTNKSGSGLADIEKSLSDDNALVAKLSETDAPAFSDAIRAIVGIRSALTLFSFALSRSGTSTVEAVIKGLAPTRADLLAFKSRLESLSPGATVDLPIEELKKSADIQFSLRLIAHL